MAKWRIRVHYEWFMEYAPCTPEEMIESIEEDPLLYVQEHAPLVTVEVED